MNYLKLMKQQFNHIESKEMAHLISNRFSSLEKKAEEISKRVEELESKLNKLIYETNLILNEHAEAIKSLQNAIQTNNVSK